MGMAAFGCAAWAFAIHLYVSFGHGAWNSWFTSPEIYQNYMLSFSAAIYGVFPSLVLLFALLGRLLLQCQSCIVGLNEK